MYALPPHSGEYKQQNSNNMNNMYALPPHSGEYKQQNSNNMKKSEQSLISLVTGASCKEPRATTRSTYIRFHPFSSNK
jgi:hypothetical protein